MCREPCVGPTHTRVFECHECPVCLESFAEVPKQVLQCGHCICTNCFNTITAPPPPSTPPPQLRSLSPPPAPRRGLARNRDVSQMRPLQLQFN